MSYVIRLSPLAEEQQAAQPEPLRAFIIEALDRLAQNPTSLTRRSAAAARGQLAEFQFDREGVSLWVTVLFLYGQDEQTLHIEHIAVEFGA